jgi:hypothetical protein
MADDYDSLLQRMINSLEPNTQATRQQLYSQAREILLKRLQTQQPAINAKSILAEQSKLDEAIERVESCYAKPVSNTRGFGSLGPTMKAAIAIPSALLIIVLCVGAYLLFSDRLTLLDAHLWSTDLTREIAEQKLKEKKINRQVAIIDLVLGDVPAFLEGSDEFIDSVLSSSDAEFNEILHSPKLFGEGFRNHLDLIRRLVRGGIIKSHGRYPPSVGDRFQNRTPYVVVNEPQRSLCLPQEGKAYEAGSPQCVALLSTARIENVTGVSTGDKERIVDFAAAIEPTDFGKALAIQSHREVGKATFSLYDDGWRITKINFQ